MTLESVSLEASEGGKPLGDNDAVNRYQYPISIAEDAKCKSALAMQTFFLEILSHVGKETSLSSLSESGFVLVFPGNQLFRFGERSAMCFG